MNNGIKRRDATKRRRGNKAEELSEGLSTGDRTEATGNLLFHPGAANDLLSGIVGIGNAPIPSESQYVVLEIAKAFQETAEFALARAATFAGDAFGDGIGREALFNQRVVSLKIFGQSRYREGFATLRQNHLAAVAQGLQQLLKGLRPCLLAGFIGVGQFLLQMRAAHGMVDIVILLVGLPKIVYRHAVRVWQNTHVRNPFPAALYTSSMANTSLISFALFLYSTSVSVFHFGILGFLSTD